MIKKLGKAELGVWSTITSLPTSISVFGSGVSGCILRYIPMYLAKKDRKACNEIVFCGIVFNLCLGLIIAIACKIFANYILAFIFNIKIVPLFYLELFDLALLVFYINFISSVLLFTLDGLQLIHVRNKIIIISVIVFCALSIIFICSKGVIGLLFAQIIQGLIILLSAFVVLIKSNLFYFKLFRFNKYYIKLFFTYGQNFQIISMTILLFDPITKYFINQYFNLSIVGVYDVINRAVSQVRALIVSAVQVVTPVISKNEIDGELDISEVFYKANRGASLLSLCVLSIVLSLGLLVIQQVDFLNIKIYFSMALFMAIAYHVNIAASTSYSIFLGLGKLNYILISHILSTVLNIGFFLFLKNYSNNLLVAAPISLAISISSYYLITSFKKEMKLKIISAPKNDQLILYLSLILCCLLSFSIFFELGVFILNSIISCYIGILLFLIYRSDFFKTLFYKIAGR